MKTKIVVFCVIIMCVYSAGNGESGDWIDCITVSVKSFPKYPLYIDILSNKADIVKKKFVEYKNKSYNDSSLNKLRCLFHDLHDYSEALNYKFENGDLVFGFGFKREIKKKEIIRKWNLRKIAEVNSKNGDKYPLFQVMDGNKHVYLILLRIQEQLYCPMHPQKTYKKKVRCSECSMDLMVRFVYVLLK